MKWNRKANGDWEAIGEDGDFLIWKEGSVWKGRYRSTDHKKHFLLRPRSKIAEIKKACEDNYYWEESSALAKKEAKEIKACLRCTFPVEKCKGACYRRGAS